MKNRKKLSPLLVRVLALTGGKIKVTYCWEDRFHGQEGKSFDGRCRWDDQMMWWSPSGCYHKAKIVLWRTELDGGVRITVSCLVHKKRHKEIGWNEL